ncbi:Gas vesicle structural protein [uncultured archaeon]|nr:Gas vesicle structural protein [uncultured archaeon]
MQPERDGSLVDILDRLLNRGAVLNADLIISVAGIPLIGLNLRAALASMETMLEYGVMEDWDKSTREWYARQQTNLPLSKDEEILFKTFGYIWREEGIISRWVPGVWNITSRRLFLWLRSPGEVLFEAPLENLRIERVNASRAARVEWELISSGGSAKISISDSDEFEEALARATGVQTAVPV